MIPFVHGRRRILSALAWLGALVALLGGSAAAKPPAAITLLRRVANGKLRFDNWNAVRWPYTPERRQLEGLMHGLSRLQPSERPSAEAQLRSVADPRLRLNLKLALYEPGAWSDYLRSVAAEDPHADDVPFPMDRGMSALVERMPDPLRKQLGLLVGELYPNVRSTSDGHGSPKRVLDAFVRAAMPSEQLVKASLQQGLSPIDAYDRLLTVHRQFRFGDRPPSGYGRYGADHVLRVARVIQRHLGSGYCVVGGSFPNGNAHLGRSDIDFIGGSELELDGAVVETMSREIRRALRVDLGASKLHLSPYRFQAKVDPSELSQRDDLGWSNPAALYIDAHKIELWIYPTPFPTRAQRQDRRQKPLRLTLE